MKPISPQRLADAMGIGLASAELWVSHVNTALGMCGCTTVEHVSQWIAQIGHESSGMARLVESLNYTPEGLVNTWPSRFPLDILDEDKKPVRSSLAERVGRTANKAADQEAIAEIAYFGRMGNVHKGDGFRFRGRALVMTTGRANYRECGQAIGADLEQEPSLLEMRGTAAASTAWYWRKHKLTGYNGDVLAVTRKINGGTNGLADRQARYDKALSVLAG